MSSEDLFKDMENAKEIVESFDAAYRKLFSAMDFDSGNEVVSVLSYALFKDMINDMVLSIGQATFSKMLKEKKMVLEDGTVLEGENPDLGMDYDRSDDEDDRS